MYITIVLLIFTLCINFVSVSGFFPIEAETGFDVNDTSVNATFFSLTGDTTTDLWLVVLTGMGAVGIVVAWITHSTAILAVYLFSAVFWISYINMLGVTNLGNYVPGEFIFIGTAGLVFVWMGAIIGMLSGSG